MTTRMSITPKQRKQFFRFLEDTGENALQEADLDKDAIQLVISRGGELQTAIVEKIRELSVNNQFSDEEARSPYGYPKKHKVNPLAQQIDELRKHFPELSLGATQEFIDKVLPQLKLPQGAE